MWQDGSAFLVSFGQKKAAQIAKKQGWKVGNNQKLKLLWADTRTTGQPGAAGAQGGAAAAFPSRLGLFAAGANANTNGMPSYAPAQSGVFGSGGGGGGVFGNNAGSVFGSNAGGMASPVYEVDMGGSSGSTPFYDDVSMADGDAAYDENSHSAPAASSSAAPAFGGFGSGAFTVGSSGVNGAAAPVSTSFNGASSFSGNTAAAPAGSTSYGDYSGPKFQIQVNNDYAAGAGANQSASTNAAAPATAGRKLRVIKKTDGAGASSSGKVAAVPLSTITEEDEEGADDDAASGDEDAAGWDAPGDLDIDALQAETGVDVSGAAAENEDEDEQDQERDLDHDNDGDDQAEYDDEDDADGDGADQEDEDAADGDDGGDDDGDQEDDEEDTAAAVPKSPVKSRAITFTGQPTLPSSAFGLRDGPAAPVGAGGGARGGTAKQVAMVSDGPELTAEERKAVRAARFAQAAASAAPKSSSGFGAPPAFVGHGGQSSRSFAPSPDPMGVDASDVSEYAVRRELENAAVIQGECLEMCPPEERERRERDRKLSVFEMVPGTGSTVVGDYPRVDHAKAVKEYARPAAAKLIKPSDVRPPAVLKQ